MTMNNIRVTKTHGHQDTMSPVASQRPKTCDLRPATRKRIITTLLIFGVAWLILPQTSQAATTRQISQFGVTWTFDKEYEYGQFANGDYWVVGPAKINAISPAFDGTHNGWQVNPMPGYAQGFDSRISTFTPNLVPSIPYTAQAGDSIVKSVSLEPFSDTGCRPCLDTAVVLTVLAAPPPDNGATVFRPPYVGTEKPFYYVSDLRTGLLPSLQPVAYAPTLADIRRDFERVQLDHKISWSGRHMHPKQNMPDYGSGIAIYNAEGALRLMLNDSINDKMPALINYVQAGIDYYGILKNGGTWGGVTTGGGGHGEGRKLPIAFAAVLLGNQEMKDAISNAGDNVFGENDGVGYSAKADRVLYAQVRCSESTYWVKFLDNPGTSGSRTCSDPYGYIDGDARVGKPYLSCCLSQNWKATSIAVRLIPELRIVWNDENFHTFSDRYAYFGVWAQPDPCAPKTGDCNTTKIPCTSANEKQVCRSDEYCDTVPKFSTDYGVKYGPDKTKPGECIKDTDTTDGIGRVPQSHGTNRNEGGWGSRFANEMWDAYRADILYGDVNSDGEISAFDAALAAHIAVDLEHPDIKNRSAAEVSGDGQVTAYDAALIAQRAVGLIEKFPVEG